MSGAVLNKSSLRNYFPLPNSIFSLGLRPGELAVYSYLMFCENRRTFTCYPSYGTIGERTGMSKNTVAKHVRSLEDKGLIKTEPTMVPGPNGPPRNGTLRYTILPPRNAVNLFYERQLEQAKMEKARQKAMAACSEMERKAADREVR